MSSGEYDFCLRAKIISNSNSSFLELIPTSCNLTFGIICKQKIYEPPKCSGNQSSQDPYQLLMDPALSNEKEKRRKEREAWEKDRREIIVNMEREL